MQIQDQSATIAFLADPANHGGAPVQRISTHISEVFLTGDRAFKLKKAVRLPYADFSTPDLRCAACQRELALNGPGAPGLYLGVRRLTRAAQGGLEWDGPGAQVDCVVGMARFADDALLSQMAQAGRLDLSLMPDLATGIARFHASAAPVDDPQGAARVAGVLTINEAGFATSDVLPASGVAALNAAFRTALDSHAPALDARAAAGFVRRCHGDLHLRNLCMWQGQVRLFDCLEFNEDLATTDTLYDLAFLLMDLWDSGLPRHANLAANRYLDAIRIPPQAEAGWALLPFFMALRAAVRAHVTATQAEGVRGSDAFDGLARQARRYFELARALLGAGPGRVVALGGLSGSGKTTLAGALAPFIAPPPGARVLESDRLRKAMFDTPAGQHLPDSAYRPQVSDRVYADLAARVGVLAAAGAPVIAAAVNDRAADRAALAQAAGARRFDGVWLGAGADVLHRHLRDRAASASDATAAVLAAQLARFTGPPRDWHSIDTSGSVVRSLDQIRRALGLVPVDDGGP